MSTNQFHSPETDAACFTVKGGDYEGEVINSNFCRRIEDERGKACDALHDLLRMIEREAPVLCLSDEYKRAQQYAKSLP